MTAVMRLEQQTLNCTYSMFVPQSSCCFPLCLSLHGTCRVLAQMYILVTHMIALQLPFHLTTVGPLAPYKSCVSHPCIARACTDCDPTIWYFILFYFTSTLHRPSLPSQWTAHHPSSYIISYHQSSLILMISPHRTSSQQSSFVVTL